MSRILALTGGDYKQTLAFKENDYHYYKSMSYEYSWKALSYNFISPLSGLGTFNLSGSSVGFFLI